MVYFLMNSSPPVSSLIASLMAIRSPVIINDHCIGQIVDGEMMTAREGDALVFQEFPQVKRRELLLSLHHWPEVQRQLFHFEHRWSPFQ